MIWNKLGIKIFIFLVILSFLGFAFFWSLYNTELILTKIVILAVFILVFVLLLRYLNNTNRGLARFLEAVKNLESIPVRDNSGLSMNELNLTYQQITQQLKNAQLLGEAEHQYFRLTLENIDVGVITCDSQGNIELFNKAVAKILGLPKLKKIEDLVYNEVMLGKELMELKPGETKLFKINTAIDQSRILVKLSELKIKSKERKLFTLQDIKTQLEESELEAWQKLIRVLTHEIMNSVTPIKSLTYSMQKKLKTDGNDKESLLKGLHAIEVRSKGLLDFVESYKNLTNIPKLSYQRVYIRKLIQQLALLLDKDLKEKHINLEIRIQPEDLSIVADEKLISQVILNLIQNAIKALHGRKKKNIQITSKAAMGHVLLKVKDNGAGISPQVIDKIFVPFFTTYEGGSGIGLSFARQVMVLHNGRIEVQSVLGEETTFTLFF